MRPRRRERQWLEGRRPDRGIPDRGSRPLADTRVIVGVMTWELHLAACHSLKDKRHVLKSLKDRLHNRFNVSAAETAHHDLWQRAELTVCVVSTDRTHAESVLREADRMIDAADGARIVDTSKRFF